MDRKGYQNQLELFSNSADLAENNRHRRTIFNNSVTLNIEHIIVLCVVILMVIVFSFSLGVEKGRRFTKASESKDIQKIEIRLDEKPPARQPTNDYYKKDEVLPKKEIYTYTIQVASFKNRSSVDEEAKRLQKKGYDVIVLPKGKWIVLCVGRFGNKREAENLQKELRKNYKDCLIKEL